MTELERQASRRVTRSEREARRRIGLPIAVAAVVLLGLAGAATIGYAALVQVHFTAANAASHAPRDVIRSKPDLSASLGSDLVEPDQITATVPGGILRLADPVWVARLSTASGIPTRALTAYAGADLYARNELGCPVGWNTLAGIGFVESEHGTLQGGSIDTDYVARPTIIGIPLDGTTSAAIPDTDGGKIDGDTAWDRAVGPMQFIPETWEQWGTDGDGDGSADINNLADAALSTARYLCHANGTLEHGSAWIAAVRSYNDSVDYQNRVADAASYYAGFTAQ